MRLSLLICFVFVGCAGRALQSNNITEKVIGIQQKSRVKGIPFVSQKKDHCGPATLSMAFNWAGVTLSQDEAAKEVFTPGASGTYQMDIVSAARRNGLMALEVSSMEDLLRELSQGTPVIVFQNLGFDWLELWHYSLVTGHDLEKRVVYLNSGKEENKALEFKKFERGWKRGGYWGLVVLPPNVLSSTSGPREHLRAAAALENIGDTQSAALALTTILDRWPQSHWAHFALGNNQFQRGEKRKAKQNFEKALKLNPEFAYAWHNYALLLKELGLKEKAHQAADKAIQFAGMNKNKFERSLKGLREMASE